ncbi:hypothetical protein CC85DRAFT_276530 [Cutaneotrichosporon oleaginosum]|uniref:AN1-type domain-containing protein n=1 Tax=Cutaneotrichosporon oleaginosum TaxID=879819 RepID=A0A0J0XJG6_9TREE|nr:uncharacterized protein CC85DRAFT_276530 [Cutaneotrichosporon oleaginosum]KLT41196.1 hypothetical protein CC85DRAFT_276530 [Cutaneotrichosporon oleaginosum]TXT14087.1 hypothetical protein COLE_00280 [Cutaneotrichosporon oleaginosum]
MSASPSPTPSSRDELMFLGTACHHRACNLHDFLPFYCPACKLAFCQPHFLPSAHQCTAPLPPSMVDRIAPQCPMCDQIVPSSADPNEAVERHILSGTCAGIEGGAARKKAILRQRKDKGEICFRRGCTKVLVVPMKCEGCAHAFCPPHRHAPAHSCTATPESSRSGTPQGKPAAAAGKSAMSRLLGAQAKPPSQPPAKPAPKLAAPKPQHAVQVEARAAAAAAAVKRAGQDVKVPFVKSKEEKRAHDELQSTIKSLKTRHDKGLLTPAEEVRYAELIGKQESRRRRGSASGGKKDKDCVIM